MFLQSRGEYPLSIKIEDNFYKSQLSISNEIKCENNSFYNRNSQILAVEKHPVGSRLRLWNMVVQRYNVLYIYIYIKNLFQSET